MHLFIKKYLLIQLTCNKLDYVIKDYSESVRDTVDERIKDTQPAHFVWECETINSCLLPSNTHTQLPLKSAAQKSIGNSVYVSEKTFCSTKCFVLSIGRSRDYKKSEIFGIVI